MPAVSTNLMLGAALDYARRGWRVVPVRARGKAPLLHDWPKRASDDEDEVAGWFDKWPDANVGVALGEPSGFIDIEFDGEEGKATAAKVFAECFTPTFTSGKSVHRLFVWRPDLPDKAKVVVNGLEVRSTGGQSVFPPSVHPSGASYLWTPGLGPDDVELQEIPDEVLAWLWNHDAHAPSTNGEKKGGLHWDRIFRGMTPGERTDGLVSAIGKMVRSIADLNDESALYVAYHSILALNDRNDPPLDEDKVRETFKNILKREQGRRASETVERIVNPPVDEAVKRASGREDKVPKEWRIVIVRSDPPTYELYAPQFKKAEGGCVRLTPEQMCAPSAIRVEALKQADAALPLAFSKAWNGTGKKGKDGETDEGLFALLMRHADERLAPPEERRDSVVAERLLDHLSKATHLEDGEKPSPRRPSKLADGSVVFVFSKALQDLSITVDKITRPEISAILRRAGASWHKSDGVRFKRLTADGLRKLKEISEIGMSEPEAGHEGTQIRRNEE